MGLGRIIVYCRSKVLTEQVSKELGCLIYHADRDIKERAETMHRFMARDCRGTEKVIAATGALGKSFKCMDLQVDSIC